MLGSTKDQLDTPLLCLDLDLMEANVQSMVATCRQHGVAWRPHAKCHKSSAIARKFVEAGALGVTCAKLGEAEFMAAGGVTDLLIANMIVGPLKVRRLVELRRKADPIVCVDHVDQARPLSEAFTAAGMELRVVIEIDLGLERVGVAAGDVAVALGRQIAALSGLKLAGIMGYEGHLLRVPDPTEKANRIRDAIRLLSDTKAAFDRAGLPCPIVSCGGTGSYLFSAGLPSVTEIQAGGGVFMDEFYRRECGVNHLRPTMTLLTTIVSRPAPDRAIIDAGRKSVNVEICPAAVVGRPDIEIVSLSAEHGTLRLAPSAQSLRIGDRLELSPGYSDLTCVLHNQFHGFRHGRLEVVWPLEARGALT